MVKIVVDEREKTSGVAEYLVRLGAYVEYRMLEIGDYLFGESVVERKRIDDLVKSVFDQRLFDQIERASQVYERVYLVVEGSPSSIRRLTENWRAVYGALAYIAQTENLSILYTSGVEETAYLIYSLAEKSGKKIARRVVRREKKPETGDLREWQEYIVQCLPHIGPRLSERLLTVFGSVQRIFNASASELSRIEGLSEEKAQEIVRIIRSPYEPRNRGRDRALF